MLHLLDASVLIDAHQLYYPIDAVPEYWSWLTHHAEHGRIKIPKEIFHEITPGSENGELHAWLNDTDVKKTLLLEENVDVSLVQQVLNNAYASDLTDDELIEVGRDPFLVAYAMQATDRRIITCEIPKPSKVRQKRKLPDACDIMGVQWLHPHVFNKQLQFSTSWHKAAS